MKLQLHDGNNTVITEIKTKVDIKGDFDTTKNEYFMYVEVNGLTLTYYGNGKEKRAQADFQKLISKGAQKIYRPLPLTEEEQGWADGTAADCANPKLHGHTVYSILAGNQSGIFVWDYYKQKTVPKSELTELLVTGTHVIFNHDFSVQEKGVILDVTKDYYSVGSQSGNVFEVKITSDIKEDSNFDIAKGVWPIEVIGEPTTKVRMIIMSTLSDIQNLYDVQCCSDVINNGLNFIKHLLNTYQNLETGLTKADIQKLFHQANSL